MSRERAHGSGHPGRDVGLALVGTIFYHKARLVIMVLRLEPFVMCLQVEYGIWGGGALVVEQGQHVGEHALVADVEIFRVQKHNPLSVGEASHSSFNVGNGYGRDGDRFDAENWEVFGICNATATQLQQRHVKVLSFW